MRREKILYLDLAECFIDTDPEIAGILAGKEVECLINRLYLESATRQKLYKPSKMPDKLEELARRKIIRDQEKEEIGGWWDTRSKVVHWDLVLPEGWQMQELREKVSEMIAGIKKLKHKLEI